MAFRPLRSSNIIFASHFFFLSSNAVDLSRSAFRVAFLRFSMVVTRLSIILAKAVLISLSLPSIDFRFLSLSFSAFLPGGLSARTSMSSSAWSTSTTLVTFSGDFLFLPTVEMCCCHFDWCLRRHQQYSIVKLLPTISLYNTFAFSIYKNLLISISS
ncbi:hypothetical protein CIPAW_08G000200 [Carya illinoinensis]|uniref:Uncharacterized protein n=1 Tax=Carya illinoinensis TaxID=32201 RepID=A0A8T1PNB5_CARIL|nr:hypothetical protein CIPAW_08G000200 [Carya illinoinensis]